MNTSSTEIHPAENLEMLPHGSRGMMKFGFKIRTRSGLVVDNLLIPGKDQADAERKLNQIYRNCEILETKAVQQTSAREETMDIDGIISLISHQDREKTS